MAATALASVRSGGDHEVGRRELGLPPLAMIELRQRLNVVNRGITELAAEHDFLLADIERLFHRHGVASDDSWYVQVIEPNLAGATAIAEHWYQLTTASQVPAQSDAAWSARIRLPVPTLQDILVHRRIGRRGPRKLRSPSGGAAASLPPPSTVM